MSPLFLLNASIGNFKNSRRWNITVNLLNSTQLNRPRDLDGKTWPSGLPKPWRDRRVRWDRYSVCFARPVCLCPVFQ